MSGDETFPPRLHAILARDSSRAVVFRRGPSKAVCVVGWDRKTDQFTQGQWLKGRLYERRADLSPDGKYLIYFAMSGQWQSETGGSWTAISRAPFLKALVLFGKGDGWNGGGLFTGKRSYWLNGAAAHRLIRQSSEVTLDNDYQPSENYGGECPGVYYQRLQRDGWTLIERGGTGMDTYTVFERSLTRGWVLRKTAHEQVGAPKGKACYWDEHQIEQASSATLLNFEDWEWVDRDGSRVVFATKGKLYSVTLGRKGKLGEPELLYDFNGMTFEARAAPY